MSTTLQLGTLSLTIAPLKLGQLKRVRNELALLFAMRKQDADIPTVEQIDAMMALVHQAAGGDPVVTLDRLREQLDDMHYADGLRLLSESVAQLMQTSGITARGSITGEAPSPAI